MCSVYLYYLYVVRLVSFFFGIGRQIFGASRLGKPSSRQMPQVNFIFLFLWFILRYCNLIAFETKLLHLVAARI
jgi:hypothetical protein